jgi:tetratricopeptide (TPR) repeat protein
MEMTQELFEKIEAYIFNRLSPPERELFEEEVKENPDLKIELEKHKDIFFGMEANYLRKRSADILNEVKKELAEEEQTNNVVDMTPQRSRWMFYAAAAVIILLLGIGYIFVWNYNSIAQSQDSAKLFAESFSMFPKPGNTMSAPSEPKTRISEAMATYNSQSEDSTSFERAEKELEILLMDTPENDTIQFFLGVISLKKDKPEKAIEYLVKVKNSVYTPHAQWYVALSYLKLNELKKAKLLFEEMAEDTSHPKSFKSSKLLENSLFDS